MGGGGEFYSGSNENLNFILYIKGATQSDSIHCWVKGSYDDPDHGEHPFKPPWIENSMLILFYFFLKILLNYLRTIKDMSKQIN